MEHAIDESIDVGTEVLVCGGNYPGAFGVVIRKTPKRFEIQRIDGTTFQVAKYNVKRANKPASVARRSESMEQRVERQMDKVLEEVEELRKLMKALSVEKKTKRK